VILIYGPKQIDFQGKQVVEFKIKGYEMHTSCVSMSLMDAIKIQISYYITEYKKVDYKTMK
jgi:hypothetical protein